MYITNDAAKNLSGVRTLSAKEFNHKEHKETIVVTLAAEAFKNLLNAAAAPTHWIAAVSAATETSRKVREVRKVINC